jgi:hypothetical protein
MPPKQPIVYRVGSFVPSTVQQSAELRPEQWEDIPYPWGDPSGMPNETWPLAGFLATDMAVDGMSTGTPVYDSSSLLPSPYNLEWVQGDTAIFQWLFVDVNWTDVDPGLTNPDAPEWVETVWNAQVRNPYIYSTYASDYWVPAYGYQYQWWRGHSIAANFICTSSVIQVPDEATLPDVPVRWATEVTVTLPADQSALILPGNWYRWDLQTRTVDNIVTTHLRGKARIVTEWTVA